MGATIWTPAYKNWGFTELTVQAGTMLLPGNSKRIAFVIQSILGSNAAISTSPGHAYEEALINFQLQNRWEFFYKDWGQIVREPLYCLSITGNAVFTVVESYYV